MNAFNTSVIYKAFAHINLSVWADTKTIAPPDLHNPNVILSSSTVFQRKVINLIEREIKGSCNTCEKINMYHPPPLSWVWQRRALRRCQTWH